MFFDDAAYKSDYPRPYRVMLKTGEVTRTPQDVYKYKSSQDRDIPGGAAMILDIPLNKKKPLKSISLTTEANDIVTGIMGITLQK